MSDACDVYLFDVKTEKRVGEPVFSGSLKECQQWCTSKWPTKPPGKIYVVDEREGGAE
jgi:hypothetical protein